MSCPIIRYGSVAILCGVLALTGCASSNAKNDQPTTASASGEKPQRLEDEWGPGEFAALLTGTVTKKNKNLAYNVPLVSWYVREKHRKGMGLLGGALAYDMVTTRYEQDQPVARRLLSHGLLGLMGRLEERRLDGTGYQKNHWFFPLYRYHNLNGQRSLYPLFFIPIPLKDDPNPPALDPAPWDTAYDDNLEPAGVDPVVQPRLETRPGPAEPQPVARQTQPVARQTQAVARQPESQRSPAPVTSRTAARKENTASGGWQSERTLRQYKVRKGDTLYRIARQEYGDVRKWKKIYTANQKSLPNPDRLREGVTLVIPD